MTNYNPKQNIETQLSLPGIENYSDVAETQVEPVSTLQRKNSKKGLTLLIAGLTALGIVAGGLGYALHELDEYGKVNERLGKTFYTIKLE